MGERITKGYHIQAGGAERGGDVGFIRSQGADGREMQRQQRSVCNRARHSNMGHTFCCLFNPSHSCGQALKFLTPALFLSQMEGKCKAQQSMLKQLHKQPEKQITESILLLKIYFHQFKAISSRR